VPADVAVLATKADPHEGSTPSAALACRRHRESRSHREVNPGHTERVSIVARREMGDLMSKQDVGFDHHLLDGR
jgi:hypothetical protein